MTDPAEERTPPSRWLQKWVREEKFWRDVVTRTLAALIVVFLGYLYAIMAGYVGAPNMWRVWVSCIVAIALAVLIAVCVRSAVKISKLEMGVGAGNLRVGWLYLLMLTPVVAALAISIAIGVSKLLQLLWG